ncbi:MAG TPA: extracellular solute-binding protein [Thermoanaerobaculia bacterium]
MSRPPRPLTHLLALAATTLTTTTACGGGADTLVLYSPHGRELLAVVEEAYEAKHPGLDVRWLDMGSQEVYDRVRSERANPQADVWFGGPSTIFARGAEEGLLEPYRPEWADAVPAELVDPEDRWFALYRTAPVLLYNAAAVTGDDVPRDWADLLAPRFADRIVVRDPLASGTMRTFFGMVLARSVQRTGTPTEGFRWLARLDEATREYVLNPALMIEKLQRQEGLVTVWELTDALWQVERGTPLSYAFPTSGTPIIADAVGLVTGAPHEAAAKRFIEWIGSEEAQVLAAERSFRLPARNDLPREELPAWAAEVIDAIVPADVDRELIARFGDDWMRTWDREIRGQGGDYLAATAPK